MGAWLVVRPQKPWPVSQVDLMIRYAQGRDRQGKQGNREGTEKGTGEERQQHKVGMREMGRSLHTHTGRACTEQTADGKAQSPSGSKPVEPTGEEAEAQDGSQRGHA